MPAPNCICKVCGAAFYTKPSLIRLRNGGQHCSRACRAVTARDERLGDRCPTWKGDAASVDAGRQRARTLYDLGPCERCGADGYDRHHKNGNTHDNRPGNVEILCRRCHMEVDGRRATLLHLAPRALSAEQAVDVWQRLQVQPYPRGLIAQISREYGCNESVIRAIRDGQRYAREVSAWLQDEAV